MKKRPFGVVSVALFYLLLGLFFLAKSLRRPELIAVSATNVQFFIFAFLVSISLVIGVGLLLLMNWARYLAAVHFLVNGASFLIASQSPVNPSVLLETALLAYLFLHPASRSAFAKESEAKKS